MSEKKSERVLFYFMEFSTSQDDKLGGMIFENWPIMNESYTPYTVPYSQNIAKRYELNNFQI